MPARDSALAHVAWVLLVAFTCLALLAALAVLALRAGRRSAGGRRGRERAELRADILTALMAEPEESGPAIALIAARRGRARDLTEAVLVDLLPKMRGEARERALDLLRERGAALHALRETHSRWSVARCRGAYALGVLGAHEHADRLVELLADPAFEVRRVAARALGVVGDSSAVAPLLALADRDPGLNRDLGYALVTIGTEAAPRLRRAVIEGLADPGGGADHDPGSDATGPGACVLAAAALGMIGDPGAVPALAEAARRGWPALVLACVDALGEIESPAGLPTLERALAADAQPIRIAAATALVPMGSSSAIPALVAAVETEDPVVSRTAAAALLRLGGDGRDALVASPSPYATEAVALADLRSPR